MASRVLALVEHPASELARERARGGVSDDQLTMGGPD
jgi:hypothetical protein